MLSGTYAFINKKISKNWLYLLLGSILWTILCQIFQYSYLINVLPLSISFSIISIYSGVIFLHNWEFEGKEKIATGITFLLWGVHKSYFIYLHPNFSVSPSSYITEILLIIALNSCLVLTYLQKNRVHLIKNEQIFRLLTENSQDLIYLCKYSPEAYFEYVSPNCLKIIGYSQEDFYSNPYLLEEILHPEDKHLFDLTLNPILSPKEFVVLRYRHKNGSYLWVEEYTTLIYDNNGNLFGIEGVIRDNTEKVLINKEMKNTEKERQNLLSTISHELKTPVTSIRGYVDAILDNKIPHGESNIKYLMNIQNKVHMLELLINDLFELSQFESNQIQFKFSQLLVEELITNLYEMFMEDVKHVGIDFRLTLDPNIIDNKIELIADMERMEQVLYNLIFNAIKHTRPGGVINLSCELCADNKISIKLTDTGTGIDERDLPHIFERFYRGRSGEPHIKHGSGLGLAITKEIIGKHFGQIQVESQLNKGTTFTITLPIN